MCNLKKCCFFTVKGLQEPYLLLYSLLETVMISGADPDSRHFAGSGFLTLLDPGPDLAPEHINLPIRKWSTVPQFCYGVTAFTAVVNQKWLGKGFVLYYPFIRTGTGIPAGAVGGSPLYPSAGAPFLGGFPPAAAGGYPPPPAQAAPAPPGASAPFNYNIPARPVSPNDNVETKEDLNIRYGCLGSSLDVPLSQVSTWIP